MFKSIASLSVALSLFLPQFAHANVEAIPYIVITLPAALLLFLFYSGILITFWVLRRRGEVMKPGIKRWIGALSRVALIAFSGVSFLTNLFVGVHGISVFFLAYVPILPTFILGWLVIKITRAQDLR